MYLNVNVQQKNKINFVKTHDFLFKLQNYIKIFKLFLRI